jgi:hypothetical protein
MSVIVMLLALAACGGAEDTDGFQQCWDIDEDTETCQHTQCCAPQEEGGHQCWLEGPDNRRYDCAGENCADAESDMRCVACGDCV